VTPSPPLAPGALLRLLHLSSPSLPVGAYSYSQGLESAIDAGHVTNESSARHWVADTLAYSVARLEAPVFVRLHRAWAAMDRDALAGWNAYFLAARDSAEFRAETVQMGYSLAKLLSDLFPDDPRVAWLPSGLSAEPVAFPGAMACACVILDTPLEPSLHAFLFAWAENQVLGALKAVPLGQVAGQRMLFSLETPIIEAASHALGLADDDIGNWTPGLSLLSMRHETQYSRIFRS
jgi:urease accessory protein